MKLRITTTYHFHGDDAPGDLPSEEGIKREISDTINLLDLGEGYAEGGPERRAIEAMRSGFTLEQAMLFDLLVARRIAERRERHKIEGLDTARYAIGLRKAVLEQCDAIEKRWTATYADLRLAMADATVVKHTGLEENSRMRRAEAARARNAVTGGGS